MHEQANQITCKKIATSARFPRPSVIAPRGLSTCPRARSLSRAPPPPTRSTQLSGAPPALRRACQGDASLREAYAPRAAAPLTAALDFRPGRDVLRRRACGGVRRARGCVGAAAQSARLTPLGRGNATSRTFISSQREEPKIAAGYLPLARRSCPSRPR